MDDRQYRDLLELTVSRCHDQFGLSAQLMDDNVQICALALSVAIHFIHGAAAVIKHGSTGMGEEQAKVRVVTMMLDALEINWQPKKPRRRSGSAVL
jgi:hypothetical protein